MKILIVDDEALTREGLIQSIDWSALGISRIFQADDGLNGYQAAKKMIPDMVLTDVRMPRMNGIEMSEKIQKLNPDCPIIFMSGYSDKEYLKAAIKLKAVSYVEKPIDAREVTEALSEASRAVAEKRIQAQTQALFQQEAASRLALRLTKPDIDQAADLSLEALNLPIHKHTCFTTMILKFNKLLSDFADTELSDLLTQLKDLTKKRSLQQIYTLKNEEFLILHLFGNEKPGAYTLERLCKEIAQLLSAHRQFFIVAGKTVSGPEKVYLSYQSAVILLQNSFFCPYGSILLYEDGTDQSTPEASLLQTEEFQQLLADREPDKALELSKRLYQQLLYNRTLLPNQVKDVYYKLLAAVHSTLYQLKLSAPAQRPDSESLMELVSKCDNLSELEQLLSQRLEEFKKLLTETSPETPTVFFIRDYIGKHYMEDTLSIKDISDHVHLSSSYICTIFKTETGRTLNQYITEYRMEKAKQLLSDPRNRISEISAKVGYADGSYFSKSFKKSVGLSPSDYREKELS